jgi:predicted CoA-substrate-specific enzyme activase
VILNDSEIAGFVIRPTGFDFLASSRDSYREALSASRLREEDVCGIFATGYGRNMIRCADHAVSEITAHAKGVSFLFPEVRGIIDIGGQDSKIIALEDGNVVDFLMNDKCAAGTGKFLEYTAKALEVPVSDLGDLSLASDSPARISSMCTVFAESEVISLRARGVSREDIAAGLIDGIARRIMVMARQVGLKDKVAFVGGVAKNRGMVAALEKELKIPLFIPEEPQITGALGAAILARSHC